VADPKIRITADTSQAQAELKRLEKALENLDTASAGIAKGLAAITAAAAGMGYAILKTLEASGQLIDASKAIGISAQSLQTFQHAAAQAGVGADQLNTTLIKLSGNLGSAIAKGSGPAIDALNRLGIPLQQIATSRPDEQFRLIATQLNAMTNPAERNALAIELFGKQGPRMLEVARGLEAAKKELEDMGLALSDLDVARLDEAGDAVDSLKSIFASGLKKAVADIAPYIVVIVNDIKEAIKEAGGFEAVWQKIKNAIRLALNIALLTAAIGALAKMVSVAIALTSAIRAAGGAMALFNTIVMRNPLMLVVGAAVALATLMGVDVVGAIEKAMGLTEKLKDVNDGLADKAEEIRIANEATVVAAQGYNEEQKKALKALDETLVKLQQNTQFASDTLQYGKDEANVRKVISEEAEKLKKVNLSLTPIQEQSLRNEIEKEQAIKRQTEEFNKQKALVEGIIQSQTDSTTKMFRDLENVRRAGRGQAPIADVEINNMSDLQANAGRAEQIQLQNINKFIQNERAKYDDVFKLDLDYNRKVEEINKVAMLARESGNAELIAQAEALQGTLLSLEQDYQDQKIAIAEAAQKKIEDRELKRIQSVLMANQSGIAQALSAEESATLQKIGQQERQKAIVAERIAFEKKSDLEKAQFGVDQAANMFAALGKENKKAFEASKALNIASAIMNTYQGATKALATYPWPFGLIAAAAAVAAGMAQVSAIRSQQYSGRALGGPVMGGTPYLVGESGPELFTPNTTGSITRNQDLGGSSPVNVNFTIVANDTQGFDQLLSSRKGVIQQIISDAMLERGQRSMM
jgi:hypothetical protein